MKHFRIWVEVKDEISGKISRDQYRTLDELRTDMTTKQNNIPYESGRFFSYSQISTLVVAFLIYIALVAIFAFSTK